MNPDEVIERHGHASTSGCASTSERRDSMRLMETLIQPSGPSQQIEEIAESPQVEEEVVKKKFPKSVLFIVGNEFCERFSYYGLRAVLAIYFSTALGMNKITATVVFHAFVMVCYFSPLLGSMLADGYLGKFRTIYYVSVMYTVGSLMLAVSAIPHLMFSMLPMSMVALFLIALGTGGIKPCVSAFGGDQFDNDQVKQRDRFFFLYYFAINAGSLISMFITPILKADVGCFGQETCYPLAFAVPALLMVISVIIFVAGRNRYKMILATDNVLKNVFKCIWHAICRRRTSVRRKTAHWLDYADDKFDRKFLSDVKAVLRVWFLYVPLPVFWALFDQQGSLWTFQAQGLDGTLSSSYTIIPEQMQVTNPMLILMLIPVFDSFIYPRLEKCNITIKPLKRMLVGGLIAGIAFFVAAMVQISVEKSHPSNPIADRTDIVFINNGPCALQLSTVNNAMEVNTRLLNATLDNKMFFSEYMNVFVGKMKIMHILVKPAGGHTCEGIPGPYYPVFKIDINERSANTVVFNVNDTGVNVIQKPQLRKKPLNGNAAIRLAYNLAVGGNQITLKKKGSKINCTFLIGNSTTGITPYGKNGTGDYCNTEPGTYVLYLPNGTDHLFDTGIEINPQNGGRYIYSIYASGPTNEKVSVDYYDEVPANHISMLWQIPQYVFITCAEIMFAITGLQFSYSQAPASMRSVLQASFLLTVALGNVIIIVISEATLFVRHSVQYFVYAALMSVVMCLFSYMIKGYVYVTVDSKGNIFYPGKEDDEQILTQRTSAPSQDEPLPTIQ